MYWKKSVVGAAAARPEVLKAVPVPCWFVPTPDGIAIWAGPADVAVLQEVGIRDRPTIILSTAVEEGGGELGRDIAGLGGTVIELGDLEIAVAIGSRERRVDVMCGAARLSAELTRCIGGDGLADTDLE